MELNEKRKIHKKISKTLSLVLRHKPEALGIELDEQGWTAVSKLVTAFNKQGISLDFDLLADIVAENDKQRFSFNDDQSLIRANQGHSLDVDLDLTSLEPPEILYHGTVGKFMASIRKEGLLKMTRQHVHLSPDLDTAFNVGGRRGKPIILRVKSKLMYEKGYGFFLSKNGVWLTEHVPPSFIIFR